MKPNAVLCMVMAKAQEVGRCEATAKGLIVDVAVCILKRKIVAHTGVDSAVY